jgi:acetylornithine deacetylase
VTVRPEAAQLLRRLVAIPSESGQEQQVVAELERVLLDLGWSPRREGRNLWAVIGEDGPLVLLNSHTDTVPHGEGWSRDPLGEQEGGRLYGRGSNDAKGPLVAMILGTARYFATGPRKGRVCLAATCEEEVMGQGLEALLPSLPAPDAALVGEPTGLDPAVSQKGLVILEITARGRSAHAAHGGGVNAITAAAHDVLALAELGFEREHPHLGSTTLAVTQIQGGERHNVIPDRCKLVVDIRLSPAYAPAEVVEQVRETVQGEVRVRSDRLAPVETPADHPLVQAVLRARPEAVPYGSPTLSDWVFLRHLPAVKIGPGDSRRSHTPDEYIELEELEQGVAFYERFLEEYFGDG